MSTRRRSLPVGLKSNVAAKWGTECWLQLPGCTGRADTMDHIMPYGKGGTDTVKNIRPACKHCNSMRADRMVQGHGLNVLVLMAPPAVKYPEYSHLKSDILLDFTAMVDALRNRAKEAPLDDAAYMTAEGMWIGAANRAMRMVTHRRVVLKAPPGVAADRWREWARLGYCLKVCYGHPQSNMDCDAELDAWKKWIRSGIVRQSVEAVETKMIEDWRRFGLVF